MFENHSVQVIQMETGQSEYEFDFASRKAPKLALEFNPGRIDVERDQSPTSAGFYFSETNQSIPRHGEPKRIMSGLTRLESTIGSTCRRDTLLNREVTLKPGESTITKTAERFKNNSPNQKS
jgi:hypothetical protein